MNQKQVFAKKSLGQHYLADQNAIATIANAIPLNTPLLLEIGPGRGAITTSLVHRAEKFGILEKDDFHFEKIRETVSIESLGTKAEKSEFYAWHGDALEFDWKKIWEETKSPADTQLVVASNLPYNVATEILLRLIAMQERIPLMVLMFQKEVGFRLAAKPDTKEFGSITVMAQNFYEVKKLLLLKPGAFKPPPKVDSIVLEFVRRKNPIISFKNREEFLRFEKFVRACFAYRRKTLENNLRLEGGKLPWRALQGKENLQPFLEKQGIDGKRRGESLTIEEFAQLFHALEASILST